MKIIADPDLKEMSTLKMGGRGQTAFYPRDYRDLEELGKAWPGLGHDVVILGRGSNILFNDGARPLSLVVWDKKDDPVIIRQTDDAVLVMADAGMGLPGLLRWCAAYGLTGLERLAGIPGKVGGAIAMNAGSYGAQTGAMLQSITVWTPETGIMDISKSGFETGYRKFRLNEVCGPFIILKACYLLEKKSPAAVRQAMKNYYSMKKSAQPVLENTAGCVFKNPAGFEPAGALLEKAGLRGKTRGGVCFSEKHANFLVNKKNGSSLDAMELISLAGEKVSRLFGADLELEIKVV
jgi:UDP-N-acetylmuramate dehydrogenase